MKEKVTKKRPKDAKKGNIKRHTGKLEITRGGMGYVSVEGLDRDIPINRDHLGQALNGDIVTVEVKGYSDNNKRREGVITGIVTRKQTEFGGRVEIKENFAFLIPDSTRMNVDIFIPLNQLHGARNGDYAIARIGSWNDKSKSPAGEIVNVLTNESLNEIAMQGILMEAGFPLSFSAAVLEDAAKCADQIDKQEAIRRTDLRDVLTVTIDPADARDFDDAISLRTLQSGRLEIGVHIADVSHYIAVDSELDREAYRRATSVYLPDRVLPMLPERLSNELCSLRPNEDKYTFSAMFEMGRDGTVYGFNLCKTIIRSDRRYSYEEVQAIIEGGEGDNKSEIMLLDSIAQNLRAERFKKGAINFSSQEVRFQLDEMARPVSIIIKESKASHQLVEEFMLLANKTVAEYVSKVVKDGKPVPFPYRVHDTPDDEKLKMFSVFALRYGVRIDRSSTTAIARSFNEMLSMVKGKPEQAVLEQLGIRTMAKAVYTTENIGHYGLGFDEYCHFTSPIRRYPDVLVHRVLEQCLNGAIVPVKNMEQQCRHCSDQERRAMEAERAANKYKQVEYMIQYIGDDFDAVISGVAAFGFWAETVQQKCEGMIPITSLLDLDTFEFLESEYALAGRNTGLRFAMGDKIRVTVAAANLEKRQIDYVLADMPKTNQVQKVKNIIKKDAGIKTKNTSSGASKRKR